MSFTPEQEDELLDSLKSIATSLELLAKCVRERKTPLGQTYWVFYQTSSLQ